ncbi:MAG: prepilin-type N-terminal cleavage/methylation domain-containing protein [Magnetococcales bacterium]|nr:prepilin-type N-terminal cleavage/methylation domain-containing protein [Magnetococcales bacterium]
MKSGLAGMQFGPRAIKKLALYFARPRMTVASSPSGKSLLTLPYQEGVAVMKRSTRPVPAVGIAGFTLVELSIVLVIIGIIVSLGFSVLPGAVQTAQLTATRSRMDQIQLAIEGFAVANNRLPCPASDSGSGLENPTLSTTTVTTCTSNVGFLPFGTLGLANGHDSWHNTLYYSIYKPASYATAPTNCTDFSDTTTFTTSGYDLSCYDPSNPPTRSSFCTKLQNILNSFSTVPVTRSRVHTARATDNACATGDTTATSNNNTNVAFLIASSGNEDAERNTSDTSAARKFDGNNYASIFTNNTTDICFDNPARAWKTPDSENNTTGYDDVTHAVGLATLVGRLNCP